MSAPLRVLVGCEESGKVRDAFRRLGHEAWSCDLEGVEPRGEWPNYHLFGDVRWFLEGPYGPWDLGIFHPPCTYLTNSGVTWLYNKDGSRNEQRWQNLDEGAALFRDCLNAPIPAVACENPIMHRYAIERIGGVKQTQCIQPWQFGHTEQKATCLWLRNLPPLQPTKNVKAEMLKLPSAERQRLHWLPPSKDRAKLRSETFDGIADAMAAQWSAYILGEYDL
jgi:hypothetical protein